MKKYESSIKQILKIDLGNWKKLATVLALFLGIIIYQLMSKIWDNILKAIYPIHTLGSLDEYWLYDDKDSLSNASILITTNQCKYEHVYDFIYNKFC